MTQFADHVRIRLILQLIKHILIVFQKLCKYFDGISISAFIIPCLLVLTQNPD